MLLTIAIVLAVLWALGLLVHITSGLIHIILLIAVVVFIFHLITGRKKV